MKAEIMNLTTYFPQLDEFQESDLFSGVENPWEVLLKIEGYLIEKIEALRKSYGSVKVPGAEVVHRTHRFGESMLVVNNLIEISSLTVVEGAGIVLSGGTVLEPGALIKAPALIGEENEAYKIRSRGQVAMLSGLAAVVGCLRACYEESLGYAKTRVQG